MWLLGKRRRHSRVSRRRYCTRTSCPGRRLGHGTANLAVAVRCRTLCACVRINEKKNKPGWDDIQIEAGGGRSGEITYAHYHRLLPNTQQRCKGFDSGCCRTWDNGLNQSIGCNRGGSWENVECCGTHPIPSCRTVRIDELGRRKVRENGEKGDHVRLPHLLPGSGSRRQRVDAVERRHAAGIFVSCSCPAVMESGRAPYEKGPNAYS